MLRAPFFSPFYIICCLEGMGELARISGLLRETSGKRVSLT